MFSCFHPFSTLRMSPPALGGAPVPGARVGCRGGRGTDGTGCGRIGHIRPICPPDSSYPSYLSASRPIRPKGLASSSPIRPAPTAHKSGSSAVRCARVRVFELASRPRSHADSHTRTMGSSPTRTLNPERTTRNPRSSFFTASARMRRGVAPPGRDAPDTYAGRLVPQIVPSAPGTGAPPIVRSLRGPVGRFAG